MRACSTRWRELVGGIGQIDRRGVDHGGLLAAAGLVRRPLRSDRPGPPQDLPLLPIDISIDQVLADLGGEPLRRRGGL